jgi:hypothetical protein
MPETGRCARDHHLHTRLVLAEGQQLDQRKATPAARARRPAATATACRRIVAVFEDAFFFFKIEQRARRDRNTSWPCSVVGMVGGW